MTRPRRRTPLVGAIASLAATGCLVLSACGGPASPRAAGTPSSGSSPSGSHVAAGLTKPGHADLHSASRFGIRAQPVAPKDPIRWRVNHMTLIDKIRQLLVPSFNGTTVPTGLIDGLHPGGLIYFSANLTSQDQTQQLSAAIQAESKKVGYPLLLMTDQEGGEVVRIPGTEGTPGGADFHGDAKWAHDVAVSTGRLMARLGVNTNLAPDADVNTRGPDGVIGNRSFGSTPGVVSPLVTAQVCGYHTGGIATTVKHFPGHGSTDTDSHLHTAVIHESVAKWRATDLPPFKTAVGDGVDMIMVGHLAFPAMTHNLRPATILWTLDHHLLRDELGFHGVIITDALNMGGVTSWGTPAQIAVAAIKAGNDMLLMPPQPSVAVHAILDAVHSGDITMDRIDASVYRILTLKRNLGLFDAKKSLSHCSS